MFKKFYRIFAVPLFQDNYSYVIEGSKSNELVLIDPANPKVIVDFLQKYF
jgi:glyoxylase-like metal-dependent hydrolase (beta-lactamase superfamily II)